MRKIEYEDDKSYASLRTPQPLQVKFVKALKFQQKCEQMERRVPEDEVNKRQLKHILKKHKKDKLAVNFMRKLRRNIPLHHLPETHTELIEQEINDTFSKACRKKIQSFFGINLNSEIMLVWSVANILQIFFLTFVLSIRLTFPETKQNSFFNTFRIFSLVLLILDMVLNFTVQKTEKGKKLKNLYQISIEYIEKSFFLDLLIILVSLLTIIFEHIYLVLISFVVLEKMFRSMNQLQKFQYIYVNTNRKERYYSLFKVFLTNFIIGHFLSVLLNLLPLLNAKNNWYIKLGISQAEWLIKYVWGYYWGTNIMLTVGFGDLSATNYHQAFFLIFIETLSCITLAYNISAVGSLINEINNSENEKKKHLKTFRMMSEEHDITEDLRSVIVNFIRQSFQIKESFQYDEYDQLIEKLPPTIKSDYKKESNKNIFFSIPFVNLFSRKTLLNLAEKIQRKVGHPEQIVRKKGDFIDFLIIQKGTLHLVCRNCSQKLHGKIIQKINVPEKERSKLVSLGFIKNKKFQYDLKSKAYTVLFYLPRNKLEECLKQNEFDYELWCSAKDKDEYLLGQNQIYECSICNNGEKHDLFSCPKLHYLPIRQHIINKFLKKLKSSQMRRFLAQRDKREEKKDTLKKKKTLEMQCDIFLKNKFGMEYVNQIKKYKRIQTEIKKKILKSKKKLPTMKTGGKLSRTQEDEFEEMLTMVQIVSNNLERNETGFWSIQCDSAHNFAHYMREYNPSNVDHGFIPHNQFFFV